MSKKDKKEEKTAKDEKIYTTPILYPDSRFIKTNTACPSLSNVIRERNWSEYDRL